MGLHEGSFQDGGTVLYPDNAASHVNLYIYVKIHKTALQGKIPILLKMFFNHNLEYFYLGCCKKLKSHMEKVKLSVITKTVKYCNEIILLADTFFNDFMKQKYQHLKWGERGGAMEDGCEWLGLNIFLLVVMCLIQWVL